MKAHAISQSVLNLFQIVQSFEDNSCTLGVFLESFDIINHNTLMYNMYKLEHHGVWGLPFDWFRNYVNKRKQSTSFNGISSSSMDVTCVPQGSVLGPLLFLMYINDMPSCLKFTLAFFFLLMTTHYSSSIKIARSILLSKLWSCFVMWMV